MREEVIMKSREEKDLGVQDSLTPERHINGICGSTHRMLTNIRVAFHYMDKDMMKKIIATMIRPRLKYAAVMWSPHKKKDVTKIERIQISKTKEEKDLGVVIQDTLSPERHINQIFGSTYRTLTNIKVAFHYMDKDMLKKILTSMIRLRLEYAAVVWSPNAKQDIRKLERVQRVTTKMVPELRELT